MDLPDNNSAFNDALASCYANSSVLFDPTDFDQLHQQFALFDATGDFVILDTSQLIGFNKTITASAAIFGAQLGAVLSILLIMLLVTAPAKRRTLPFLFNVAALLCDFIRCVLQLVQLNGPTAEFPVVALDYSNVPGATQIVGASITGSFFTFFLFVSIELALITQVHVICLAAASRRQRLIVIIFTTTVGLVAVAFRLYLMSLNIYNTLHISETTDASQDRLSDAQNMSNVSTIVSIAIFSAVFCYKLYLAIRNRRRLGIDRFGTMEIILVGAFSTLVVPVIFAILDYYALAGSQLGSLVDTLVAISLPLTGLWAASNANGHRGSSDLAAPFLRRQDHPQHLPSHEPASKRLSQQTLVATGLESSDGLRADERRFRSRYDLQDGSNTTMERHFSERVVENIEMEHLPLAPGSPTPNRLPAGTPARVDEEGNGVFLDTHKK